MIVRTVVVLACVIGACRTAPPEGRFACTIDRECPPGMRCSDGLCYTNLPSTRDASTDAAFDAARDANDLPDASADSGGEPDAGAPCPPMGMRMSTVVSEHLYMPTTWTCDRTYVLGAPIEVRTVLTIQKGTRIVTSDTAALLVQPTGRLVAIGTALEPIVFGPMLPGAAQWGGIVLLGRARVNNGTGLVLNVPTAFDRGYGGMDDLHDCGELRFVRIEGAGYETFTDQAYAGLALAACGSRTRISYVQVHQADSDGIEIYGGTVRADHIVVTDYVEDAIDWNFGWTGGIQFLATHTTTADGVALEGESNRDDPNLLPRSDPSFFNATLLGANRAAVAISIDNGTLFDLSNAVIANWQTVAFELGGADLSEQNFIDAGAISVHHSIFWQIGPEGTNYTIDEVVGRAIDTPMDDGDPELESEVSVPLDFEPTAPTGLTAGGGMEPRAPYDATATFRGAMRHGDDWTDPWANLE